METALQATALHKGRSKNNLGLGVGLGVGLASLLVLGLAVGGGKKKGKGPGAPGGCAQPSWPASEPETAKIWPRLESTARAILIAFAASRSTQPVVAETTPWRPTASSYWRWAYAQAGIVGLRAVGLQPCIPAGQSPLHLRLAMLADEAQQLLGDTP